MQRQNGKRWLVERTRDVFDDVGADKVRVDGGTLIFESGHPFEREIVLIYAPGTWLTVTPEDES